MDFLSQDDFETMMSLDATLMPLFIDGHQTVTILKGKHFFLKRVQIENYIADVLNIKYCNLIDISCEDVSDFGFNSTGEMFDQLTMIYPDLTLEDTMTIINVERVFTHHQ